MLFLSRFIFVMTAVLSVTALSAADCYMNNYADPSFYDDDCCVNYSDIYVGAIGYGVNR